MDIGDLGFADNNAINSAEKNDEESKEKQKFINDNIISKGYNLEDLSSSITMRTGLTINEISLDTLKKETEFFKTQSMKETYKATKSLKSGKSAKDDYLKELYEPENIDLKTTTQLESKLTEFEKQQKKINPIVNNGNQLKASSLFGSKISYTFNVECAELGTKVERSLEDFVFFQNVLNERYPFRSIPPLLPEKYKDNNFTADLLTRYLNRFLQHACNRKILRTSPITLEFLELNKEEWATYKTNLSKNKYVCQYNMENYTTLEGYLKFSFNQDQVYLPEKSYKKLVAFPAIYNNLNNAMGKIINDFNNLGRHMKQASDAFSALYNFGKEHEQDASLIAGFEKLKNIFTNWSASYDKQKFFLDHNFREFFDYMNLQVKELSKLNKQYTRIKTDYEQYGLDLLQKKEKLFDGKQYSKWELNPDDEKNIEYLKENRESAYKCMLPGLTNLVSAQKVQLACSANIVQREYEKFAKHQGDKLKEYLLSLKDKNQTIMADAYILSTLFNIEF